MVNQLGFRNTLHIIILVGLKIRVGWQSKRQTVRETSTKQKDRENFGCEVRQKQIPRKYHNE
jgi:hypothetical protein